MIGAGAVVTNPITRVRGEKLQSDQGFWGGYFLSGGNLVATATRSCPVVAGAFLGSAVGHFLVNRHGEEEKGFLSKAKASLQLVPIRHGLAARVVM